MIPTEEDNMEYDRVEHQRRKLRRLEQENEALHELNTKLIRMLALACQVGAGSTGVDPVKLCAVIEEMAA
jgi:hypothetical protein